MRLLLLGPPGAGKGTQAALLSEKFGVPHISTGDLFRNNIARETPLGLATKEYLEAGELVPAELTVEMTRNRLLEPDASNGFLLDGFPRTIVQADALASILAELGQGLDAVLEFRIDDDLVVRRMLARGRADDSETVIRHRLRIYHNETRPLLDHYADRTASVDAVGDVAAVHQRTLVSIGAS
ncbi:adenylate kinase [Streptomyces phaeochromogenes]|uniref:adenylate kinase n=1 Tax=Streptomyces phaeochromogenes TaxID=1923 RepID=UPI002DD9AB12|nr:adenylate kinase [Streptomyces phaeochromogenes]WRZ34571.1 adenylate kinase [Streptomyces phaeochromogenes]